MNKEIYIILDYFLTITHTLLIIFNLTGWIWNSTRKLNFYSLLLVAFSWGILGICFGPGYCPLTDLHWYIKFKAGEIHLPYSYIKYLIDFYFGIQSDPEIVDNITLILFVGTLLGSFYMNYGSRIKKRIMQNQRKMIEK